MSNKRKKISSNIVAVPDLTEQDREVMFSIFVRHYNNADPDIFRNDLSRKNHVVLIRDKEKHNIVGFTTMATVPLQVKGKKALGIFSGDTIVEPAYWGCRGWQIYCMLYALRVIVSNPLTPIYWLLISKGYKTYLIMTRNIPNYYPNRRGDNEHLASVAHSYCDQLFPGYYNAETGLLNFGNNCQSLKAGIAEVTEELCRSDADIATFSRLNPTWREGTELPCVGQLNLVAVYFFFKRRCKTLAAHLPLSLGSTAG